MRLIAIDDRPDKSKNLQSLFRDFKNYEYIATTGEVGYGESLRLGSQVLKSEFVGLMNSDDTVVSNRFLNQVKMLESSELSISKMNRIDSRGRSVPSILGDVSGPEYSSFFLLFGAYGANATWCTSVDWWKKNAFFDSKECLDWRIALNSFPKTNISYSEETLYNYRRHKNQVTSRKNIPENEFDELYKLWAQFGREFISLEMPREVFNILAVPWNQSVTGLGSSYSIIRKKLLLASLELNQSVQNNVERFIKRRDLLALLRPSSFGIRSKILFTSFDEIFPLSRDAIVFITRATSLQ